MKYIVYLTDVDEDSGPHIFIPGSHKQNKLLPIRRYTAAEIAGAFGQGNEKLFVGPAGTSFLETPTASIAAFRPRANRVLRSPRPTPCA